MYYIAAARAAREGLCSKRKQCNEHRQHNLKSMSPIVHDAMAYVFIRSKRTAAMRQEVFHHQAKLFGDTAVGRLKVSAGYYASFDHITIDVAESTISHMSLNYIWHCISI